MVEWFLINYVLNSITIFFLSFMTMPVKVWKQIVRLQKRFFFYGEDLREGIKYLGLAGQKFVS